MPDGWNDTRRAVADHLRDSLAAKLRFRQRCSRPCDRTREWREAMRYARLLTQYGEDLRQ